MYTMQKALFVYVTQIMMLAYHNTINNDFMYVLGAVIKALMLNNRYCYWPLTVGYKQSNSLVLRYFLYIVVYITKIAIKFL